MRNLRNFWKNRNWLIPTFFQVNTREWELLMFVRSFRFRYNTKIRLLWSRLIFLATYCNQISLAWCDLWSHRLSLCYYSSSDNFYWINGNASMTYRMWVLKNVWRFRRSLVNVWPKNLEFPSSSTDSRRTAITEKLCLK